MRSLAFLLACLAVCGALALMRPLSTAADRQPPSFSRDGVAFLEKHCVHCHNDKKKKADVALHAFKDDASLVKNRKLWARVIDVLKNGEMPPRERKQPLASEIETFLASVKAVFDAADKNAKPDPGRVTIRRLNRTEYNNTIRDLVGIDFNPAEDFPSDDVGHGFDNVADVLTLSPVLMERYLAAAESITQRAIVARLPKPSERWVGSRYLEPAQNGDVKFRPLDKRGNVLHTPYKITLSGEFVFRFKAYANLTDKEPVKVAVRLNDKEIKTFEVSAPKEKPVVLEVKMDVPRGDHRVFVKLLNPTDGEKGRNLFVEWFNLRGPSDMRPETHRKLLASKAKDKDEQTREVLQRFASQAFRRPATKDEVDRLVKLVSAAQKDGDSWEAGVQVAMQAVLVSPKFLFRVEADAQPREDKPYPIDEYHLASRLSYFLWSSMPDQELFDLAAKKELSKNLDAQVKRMLKDPKAAALTENFALQWLQLRRLKTFSPDAKLFPTFNDQLRSAMLTETELFFAEIVREDRSVLDLIDGRYTYLNDRLSWHYNITDTVGTRGTAKPAKSGGQRIRGSKFVRVELPEGGDRGGILTHASVLTVTSNPTRTSPVKRGRWVLEQILGTPPPPPPPDVPELVENEKAQLTGSLRQRMEQHRKNPSCANCHARMDPIGFAFENYDAIGKWRTKDGKFEIDPSGTLPDNKVFKGPAELKKILKDKKDLFARNLVEKLMIYALGRGLEHYDRPAIDAIVAALAKNEYKFSVLVTEITKSLPFRYRRGKEQSR
jgi:hypothetical protein